MRYTSLTTTISHDNNHRTSKHASTSWRSDGSPSCLGGSSHGWVPVKTQCTRAHFGGEALGCSLAADQGLVARCFRVLGATLLEKQLLPKIKALSSQCSGLIGWLLAGWLACLLAYLLACSISFFLAFFSPLPLFLSADTGRITDTSANVNTVQRDMGAVGDRLADTARKKRAGLETKCTKWSWMRKESSRHTDKRLQR